MQIKLMTRMFAVWLLTLLISAAAFGQEKKIPNQELTDEQILLLASKARNPPSGPGFYIEAIQGTKSFSVLVSNGNQTVAAPFTSYQVDVFEAVLLAAKAFALTDEKVGSGTPITTRLMDEQERSLFVDVTKLGNQSRFYVTLDAVTGKVTAPAGEITRGSKKEPSGLLLTMLSQIQQAKQSASPQL
jgi:hypothetical protein